MKSPPEPVASLVSAESIEDAHASLRGVVEPTPLVAAHWLQDELGADVRFKCENLQRTGAFKFRGAYTFISRLAPERRRYGVIAASSGNHAQAVAWVAKLLRIPAVVVMPTTAARNKVAGARALGAEIVQEGTTFAERYTRAQAIARAGGQTLVPSFDHPDIIAGQGTAAVELVSQWPEVEAVLVPAGGGGQVSGIGAWIKRRKPECLVIGVQPEAAAALKLSLERGALVQVDATRTVADGLRIERVSELTLAHAKAFVDAIVTVSDDAIVQAAARLLREGKLLAEFSGATVLAAVLSGRWHPEGRRTALVLSGGNLDDSAVATLATLTVPRSRNGRSAG